MIFVALMIVWAASGAAIIALIAGDYRSLAVFLILIFATVMIESGRKT